MVCWWALPLKERVDLFVIDQNMCYTHPPPPPPPRSGKEEKSFDWNDMNIIQFTQFYPENFQQPVNIFFF